jgi:hypothetical protein
MMKLISISTLSLTSTHFSRDARNGDRPRRGGRRPSGSRLDLIYITLNQMKKVRYTNQILVISGSVLERYIFDQPVLVDPLPQSKRHNFPLDVREKKTSREYLSIQRSKKAVERLIAANAGFHLNPHGKPYKPVFITFTFRENMTDPKKANYLFTKFIQRFNYDLFGTKQSMLRYLAVIEFQKRGAIHYHAMFFNLPYRQDIKPRIEELWGQGFINLKTIKQDLQRAIRYLTKYLTKENFDSRLIGKKCYFGSQKLIKPAKVKDELKVNAIMHFVQKDERVFEKTYPKPAYGPSFRYEKYIVQDRARNESLLDLFVKPGYFDSKL